MKINIGIDASRNRSGGAKAHIIGILTELESLPIDIEFVHLWSYKSLLDIIPDRKWLIKHSPNELEKGLISQVWWQYRKLKFEARKFNCDIILNTDAGTICRFRPSVTMSRDMLSYEKGEIERFNFSFSRLRLILLKYIQNYSLKNSDGAIFLTRYASDVIQKSCGKIDNYCIIPHGVNKLFRFKSNMGLWEKSANEQIECIYISNVAIYKHQWNVIKAIKHLRNFGYNLKITFVGGGEGIAQQKFNTERAASDPNNEFINQLEFIDNNKIPELLKKSDIFIFASSCENMPNTLVEGMSCGLPIACSNKGPMPEVLKDGGIYFNPEDYHTIASAIEEIIVNKEKRINLSIRAKELSNQYSWNRCANETLNFLINTYKLTKKYE